MLLVLNGIASGENLLSRGSEDKQEGRYIVGFSGGEEGLRGRLRGRK
jgi:hypothetical protein